MYVWHWVTRQSKWVRQAFCPQFVHSIEEVRDIHSTNSALEGGSTSTETSTGVQRGGLWVGPLAGSIEWD